MPAGLIAARLLLSLPIAPAPDEALTLAEFERLHAELPPQAEVWKTIPWHTELGPAQRQAAEEKKLIFLWAMDGHPLGCT